MDMEKEKKIRNTAIIFGILLVLMAVVLVPLWNKQGAGRGVEQAGAIPSPGGQGDNGAQVSDGGKGTGYPIIRAPGENRVPDSKNTIMDSSTGAVVFVPQSDPEQSPEQSENVETIRESRTGEEVPMPTSDPESGK